IGSHKPGRDFVGTITKAQIKEIAENKMPDLNCSTIESAMNIVAGQCRSMGVKVEE
ncbi:MAG: 50S ribosomal protein L11, partial [Alphaproteobacteria bacterium]|nr:50S ribosomal protein L11 [Alphaproteobacteria bacterium]